MSELRFTMKPSPKNMYGFKHDFFPPFPLTESQFAPVYNWCEEQFGEYGTVDGEWPENIRWTFLVGVKFAFRDEVDAINFRLRWC